MGAEVCEYILAFRCLNCSRHEACARFASEVVLSDEDVRMRILDAHCNACGWKGAVCGVAASEMKRVGIATLSL